MVYGSSFSYGFEGHNVVGVDRFGGVDDISMFFLGEFIPDVRADSLTNSGGYVHVARAKRKRARMFTFTGSGSPGSNIARAFFRSLRDMSSRTRAQM